MIQTDFYSAPNADEVQPGESYGRLVAALGPGTTFGVYLLIEKAEPGQHVEREGNIPVLSGLSKATVEHLWMQLGKAIGRPEAFEAVVGSTPEGQTRGAENG